MPDSFGDFREKIEAVPRILSEKPFRPTEWDAYIGAGYNFNFAISPLELVPPVRRGAEGVQWESREYFALAIASREYQGHALVRQTVRFDVR